MAERTAYRGIALTLAAAMLALALAGCVSVPPQHIPADRMEYGQVLAESWKRQTLMNVVRLRYGDAPIFLDVGSIINSYSVAGKASATATFPSRADPNVLELGTEGTWSNTPTVTFQPLMGERFTRSLLQPIQPAALLALLQSGWRADLVFRIVVRSINGLRNASAGVEGDPRFREFIDLFDHLQAVGGFDMRLQPRKDGSAVIMVFPKGTSDGSQIRADLRRLVELLGLSEDATELEVVYGLAARSGNEIAIITRSMLELLMELGFTVDLPEDDVNNGSTLPGRGRPGAQTADPLVRIHSGVEAPPDTYAAASYRGHWFWIDGNDIASKSTFTFLLILFSLAETGHSPAAPVVTVPSR